MYYNRDDISNEQLINIYNQLLRPRLIEEKMLLYIRQGRISKWFAGIGQEAISVGATMAMQPDEWILPLHRNLGVFTSRNIPLKKLFLQWQGSKDGFSKGRERSFHFGSKEHHICGMISHLGPQLSVADGIALAYHLNKEEKVALVFTGEGGTSEGEFHEALNLAAVWGLPVIFLVERNGYALSTPESEQFKCENIADKAIGYGMQAETIDGNNVLDVYKTVQHAREYCLREKAPYLLECCTFRMRGHEEASGTAYVPKELLEEWAEKDPVKNFENFLEYTGLVNEENIESLKHTMEREIEQELYEANKERAVLHDVAEELADVYAPAPQEIIPVSGISTEKKYINVISDGLRQAMQKHENLILMGQDIAEYGGAFKITQGLIQEFGKERVRNTPLCESAVIGAALGLSLEGYKSVVEMQFADFVTCGFNQIINNLAKIHYRWEQNADVVIRLPAGGGLGAGPFHSQNNEAWFAHTPGLKVVYPATPEDAKGLLLAAIEDPNPVLYFEHKGLYRSISGQVPEDYYTLPIGKANNIRRGDEVSIITYGLGVHWALEYVDQHPEISIDILDLRSLLPYDKEAIKDSVKRTGKILILHEATLTAGFGAEISAWIGEHCFEYLDAPVIRCASLDTPIPFAKALEQQFLAKRRLGEMMERLLSY